MKNYLSFSIELASRIPENNPEIIFPEKALANSNNQKIAHQNDNNNYDESRK